MPTVRLDISYDGSAFRGWAAQPGLRTVQGELEAALATLLREPVRLTVAGRTDTGVHAWGQVASFGTAAEMPADLAQRLNGIGPPDVAVRAAAVAGDDFDARRAARSRTYCYRVLAQSTPSPLERGRALWWPYSLDLQRLRSCASMLLGGHDFTAFTPTQTEHVRFERQIFRSEWSPGEQQAGGIVCFSIEADAFMRNMVRVLVGTMLEIGAGRRSIDELPRLLRGAPRQDAGETAPAHGLYLVSVSF